MGVALALGGADDLRDAGDLGHGIVHASRFCERDCSIEWVDGVGRMQRVVHHYAHDFVAVTLGKALRVVAELALRVQAQHAVASGNVAADGRNKHPARLTAARSAVYEQVDIVQQPELAGEVRHGKAAALRRRFPVPGLQDPTQAAMSADQVGTTARIALHALGAKPSAVVQAHIV